MKRNIFLTMTLFASVAVVLLAGCQKESDIQGMRLVAEGFDSGSKAAVSGNAAYWVDGETVRINGVDKTVIVSGSAAYVTEVDEPADGIYRALYPASLNAGAALTDNSVTVAIPSVYVYRTDDHGRQALDLPMAGYGTSGERLVFKHLTAAITVEVINNFGIDITVDSIVVTSDSYQISGSRDITLGESIEVLPNSSPASAADRRVVVRFNGGTALTVVSGDTARVQVPVLPVGNSNKFTISVATHNVDEAQMQYTFSRTQANGGALPRARMAYAAASFGGVFTVGADGHKVRFAPGNLQYKPSTAEWRFALHQYDNAAFNIYNYSSSSTQEIDLFGFATSGQGNHKPYYKYSQTSYYTPTGTDNIKETDYDWGWYNAISNGGNVTHRWRIMDYDEWNYIITNRSSKIGMATVKNLNQIPVVYIYGIVILPDEWNNPLGRSFVSWPRAFSQNIYSEEEWALMEVSGAVFLPANGFRTPTEQSSKNYGYYWTEQFDRTNKVASYFMFSADSLVTNPGKNITNGLSVRPVRDVQ